MAVDRLGAGVQRLVALLGSLVLARATVVAIAEPELALAPSSQQRLLRSFRTLLETPGGPNQLLLTTHSPILGGIEGAFALEPSEGAQLITKRPWEGGSAFSVEDTSLLAGPIGSPDDLDQLIGLVDQLSELEPEALVKGSATTR